MSDKCIEGGYMYEFSGKRRWRKSKDDNWGTVSQSRVCGRLVGSREIDGVRVNVLKTNDGRFFAAKPTSVGTGNDGSGNP